LQHALAVGVVAVARYCATNSIDYHDRYIIWGYLCLGSHYCAVLSRLRNMQRFFLNLVHNLDSAS
jgi:hypothetical protein